MKKIKSLLVVSLLTFIAVSMAGCSVKKQNPNFVVPAGGYDGSEVTIKFYHTMGDNLQAVLDEYIAEFNKIYPNIHIDDTAVGGYDDVRDQISTEITVGGQPNIAYNYPDHVALYNLAGAVVQLDDLIASKESDGNGGILGLTAAQKADFIQGYYNEGSQFGDGFMYSLPFSKSTEVLYYNKTFFAEHNISVPDHWFSVDENDTTSMEYVCALIKTIDTNPNTYPLGYDSEANWFITMTEQLGSKYTSATGDHFLFNNAENKSFVKKFREWHQKGWVTTQEIYGAYTSGLFTETDPTAGHSYMSIGSSAGATHQRPKKVDDKYPFEVGITSIPQMDKNNPKVISQGPSICIFAKSNPQEVIASWLFVKYLTTSIDFQAAFSMASGYIPVIKSVNQNATYAEFVAKADGGDNIAALSAKVALEQEKAYYTSPAFNGSSVARDQVGALLQKVMVSTEVDVDAMINKAFKDAIDECEYRAG
jgi:multiple sugar transport system substrate-binding protein